MFVRSPSDWFREFEGEEDRTSQTPEQNVCSSKGAKCRGTGGEMPAWIAGVLWQKAIKHLRELGIPYKMVGVKTKKKKMNRGKLNS